MADFDQVVFGKKTMADICKDIYDTSKNKEKQLKAMVDQLNELVQNVGDAVQIVPLIGQYMEIAVKNDEAVIKMAGVAQKVMARSSTAENEDDKAMTPEERAQLLATYDNVKQMVAK